MATLTGDAPRPNGLALWWQRKRAERRAIALAALDMHERYGPAAYGIARNSALRAGAGAAHRRFWRRVARRIRRKSWGESRFWRLAGLVGSH
jgi:hypothetical protein